MNITKFCLDGQTGHDLFWMEGEIESAILSNEAAESWTIIIQMTGKS